MTTSQQLFIDGVWCDARSGATHEVINAFTGQAVTAQASAGPADVAAAVQAAAAAFPAWAAAPPAERGQLLTAAGDLLESRAEEIAAVVGEETAGTFGWGMFNVGLAAGMFRAAGQLATAAAGEEPVVSEIPGLRSSLVRVPLGVCVGIAPWNAPVILGTRAVVWALAFGNTVVLKASEQSPRVHGAIVAALADAGAPAGVINLITNDPADAADVVHADRRSGDGPHQLHRFHPRGHPDRPARRPAAQAHAARARRQGPARRPRRCRPRRGGGRGEFRRVHELRTDLHVDRADRG
jgi:acyl-CoA reductase-like NAD-dependent aldehyde dehydrogenase